ncbi:Lantern alpha beta hydrolase 2 [Photinus pyralis]|uniref:Lantern alpha beta hydrolase 2 n=2 Tax=Photinus pyralis TaxID=7054 RepID=A0A5N4AGQ6_PHOPY|nr:serine hydrolase-like protein [Photinus pyralis]KAB0796525.1 Lantern alpha beta hydrolase 2 [Photinus pyralis]
MATHEVKVPVFWGHIAVKTWGEATDPPILMVHGVRDNAGSFDRLIPMLPPRFYYICPDLPSHGLSSKFPPHTMITSMDYILTLKLILDHFKKEKYIFFGHSYGGQLLMMFAQIYPHYVSKLITLDSFYLLPMPTKSMMSDLVRNINKVIALNNTKQRGIFYLDGVDKIKETRMYENELDEEAAMCLADRCLAEHGKEMYIFSTDARISSRINPFFDLKVIIQMLHHYKITCPFLFIYTTETKEKYSDYCHAMIDAIRTMPKCRIEEISENHDAHLNEPESVAPLISKFLEELSKL